MNPFDMSGKIAVVNGASRGIGEAIAKGLADCGVLYLVSDQAAYTAGTTLFMDGGATLG